MEHKIIFLNNTEEIRKKKFNNYIFLDLSSCKTAGLGNLLFFIYYLYFSCKKYNKELIIYSPKLNNFYQQNLLNIIISYFNFFNFSIFFIDSHDFVENDFIDVIDFSILENENINKIYYINPVLSKIKNYKYSLISLKNIYNFLKEYNYQDKLLQNNENIKQDILKKYPNIQNSICINIRRGDKLNIPRFPIIDKTYFYQILKKYENETKIFVSDNINWCKNYFQNFKNVQFVEHKDFQENSIIYDLIVLSLCKHLIIDLSCTFSLWGYLLNNNVNKELTIMNNEYNLNYLSNVTYLPLIESNENKPIKLLIITRLTRLENIPIIYKNILNLFENSEIDFIWYICYDKKFNLEITKIQNILLDPHIIFKTFESKMNYSADILNYAIFDENCKNCIFTYILDDDNLLHANLLNIIKKYKNSDLIINQLETTKKNIINPQNLSQNHCVTFVDWANVIINTNILKYINRN